jgi:hypothetical protein
MGGPTAKYEKSSDGIAVITLINPPVNALHPDGESDLHIALAGEDDAHACSPSRGHARSAESAVHAHADLFNN